MNYRHIYHAGNICDVVKHSVLMMLLDRLCAKESAFAVLDTHAGPNFYDLTDERATKTGEAESGIRQFLKAPRIPELASYYEALTKFNPDSGIRFYPGSSLLTQQKLRAQDRLTACELHPEDAQEVKKLFANDARIHMHQRDAYEAMGALLPPAEKRGFVLIDPPYETGEDFAQLTRTISTTYKRWPHGQYVVWYPIKERPTLWRWHEDMLATGIRKQLVAEFIYHEETRHDRLNGCGLLIINPPWQFDETLQDVFPAIHRALNTEHQGSSVKWLVGE